jgi:hypothetical protein
MDKRSEQYFRKLKAHLPLFRDPTAVILRGHLLIEELLDELITASLKDASALMDARLTFFQKLCIAQGIIGRTTNDLMWKPIKELNKLRNEISHKLPDATFSRKMDAVLKTFFEDEFDQIPNNIHSKSRALRKGIIFHCALLYGFIKGMSVAKSSHLTNR